MKKNGNDRITGDYYIGLDIGTDSVGWAATDSDYNLLRLCGKDAWGIRLFDEGETAENRRLNRTARRRLQRRKWRMQLLRELFSEEIAKVDAGFYQRLDESSRITSDKKSGVKYSLFADKGFTDRDYHRNYPTVYHLRDELIKDSGPHDVRLVFLAINHILKSRGHFLYSLDIDGDTSFESLFENFRELVASRFEMDFSADNVDKVKDIIGDKTLNTTKRSERLKELIKYNESDKDKALKTVYKCLVQLLAGGKVSINSLFYNVEFEDKVSFCINNGEEQFAKVCDLLGDDADLITAAKSACDKAVLDKITNNYDTFSEYKISKYNEHHDDIKTLKDYVKNVLKDKKLYGEIFDPVPISDEKNKKENEEGEEEESKKKKIIANYAAYSRYRNGDVEGRVSQEDFCKFLKTKLGDTPKATGGNYAKMFERIKDNRFAPKLRTSENGIIANSLHRKELVLILKNAEKYLPFLAKKDENGKSVSEKILAIFDYKLPYYVGPLRSGWAVRKEGKEQEKILPWNIGDIIDDVASAKKFIDRMTSVCTYTGDDVLPLDSLLYSEFCVLNEINNIKTNGNPIDVDTKKKIYDALFKNSRKKVTKKSIAKFLQAEGLIKKDDSISGIDDIINANLNSYHDLKNVIEKTSYDVTEDIIRHIVLLGDEKKMLARWIKENTTLNEEEIKQVCRLKYKKWGRLSKKLLTGIYDIDRVSGAKASIMDMLRNTNENLMKLLSDRYGFAEKTAEYKRQKAEACDNPRKLVDELYVSPKVRRAIWQSMRIVDEIVDIKKCAPKKIFIEVARDQNDENKKGKRTNSKKEKLLELYKECEKKGREFLNGINVDKEDFDELKRKLENESDRGTMGKHLYLYYMQFGKCMYSGRPIEFAEIKDNTRYDIDHIFPRSKIKDDSFDNTVLVEAKLNRDKTDIYPISEDIRKKMTPFWKHLKDIGAISQKKFERLVRHTPLTEDELAEFINRQLVETRQSTKAVAEMLGEIYPARLQNALIHTKTLNLDEDERLKLAFNPDYVNKKIRAAEFLTGFANYGITKIFENISSGSALVAETELYKYFESLSNERYDEILKTITLEDAKD